MKFFCLDIPVLISVFLSSMECSDVGVCFDISKYGEFKRGQRLLGYSYKEQRTLGIFKCIENCKNDSRCVSINYRETGQLCEFNIYNSTHIFSQIQQNTLYILYDVREIQLPACTNTTYVMCETDWMTVFRGTPGIGDQTYDSYLNTNDYYQKTTVDYGCYFADATLPCTSHYRHPYLDKWNPEELDKVKLSLYKDGVEDKFLVFDAADTNITNWFSQNKLLESPWTDLNPQSSVYIFKSEGGMIDHNIRRRFYIHYNIFGGCANDEAWMLVRDEQSFLPCKVDQVSPFPQFIYSKANTRTWINDLNNLNFADVLLISVKHKP